MSALDFKHDTDNRYDRQQDLDALACDLQEVGDDLEATYNLRLGAITVKELNAPLGMSMPVAVVDCENREASVDARSEYDRIANEVRKRGFDVDRRSSGEGYSPPGGWDVDWPGGTEAARLSNPFDSDTPHVAIVDPFEMEALVVDVARYDDFAELLEVNNYDVTRDPVEGQQ